MKAQKRLSTSGKGRERRNEPALEIQAAALSDDAIQGLVDDWLVPMIVDQLVEALLKTGIP
jgi:hypothetical protein